MHRKGSISIDLIIAFILALYLFYLCSVILTNAYAFTAKKLSQNSELAQKIARSYEVISQLSNGRDNEILLSKLRNLGIQNVSLKTRQGYVYGGSASSLCINRIVYIYDMGEVGLLEVC